MWGGSNVPPRMPRCTRAIYRASPSDQPESPLRRGQAAEQPERIDIDAVDPGGPVQRRAPVGAAGPADHRSPGDPGPAADADCLEVGVGGAERAAVVDRDRSPAGDDPGERHPAARGCADGGARRRREVDTPMPGVPADRREAGDDPAGDRAAQRSTTGGQPGGGRHAGEHQQHAERDEQWSHGNLASRWRHRHDTVPGGVAGVKGVGAGSALHGPPHPLRAQRQVQVVHPERREGVDDGVHDRRRQPDGAALRNPLGPERVLRAGGDGA